MNITVTASALEYLQQLIDKQPAGTGVRLFVNQGGTPHAETCLAYRKPHEDVDDHSLLDNTGALAFYVEDASAEYLEAAFIDYQTDKLGGQLTIKAPNAKMKQVDENSSMTERVNYLLYTEINPALASHGGFVMLEEMVEDDTVAVLALWRRLPRLWLGRRNLKKQRGENPARPTTNPQSHPRRHRP